MEEDEVESLSLSFRPSLHRLPEYVTQMRSLRYLYLTKVGMTEFPDVYRLDRLVMLVLDYNQICVIPDDICDLDSLKLLSLRHNRVEYFPTRIIRNLVTMYLDHNCIQEFPDFIYQMMPQFEYLSMTSNPMSYEVCHNMYSTFRQLQHCPSATIKL